MTEENEISFLDCKEGPEHNYMYNNGEALDTGPLEYFKKEVGREKAIKCTYV